MASAASAPATRSPDGSRVGYLVYVGLGADSRPQAVPSLAPETDGDRRRMAEAEARQRARLASQQMRPGVAA